MTDAISHAQLGSLLDDDPSNPHPAARAPRLSSARRLQLLHIAAALVASHWRQLSASPEHAASVLRLIGSGLAEPAEDPAGFRVCLAAAVKVHERWAGGGAVSAARAALGGVLFGGGGGCSSSPEVAVPRSPLARPLTSEAASPLADLAMTLRCHMLHVRLDPSHASLHEEATEGVHAALSSEARAQAPEPRPPLASLALPIVEACLRAERPPLPTDGAQRLLTELQV